MQTAVDTEKVANDFSFPFSGIVCSLKIYDIDIFKRRQNNNPEYRRSRLKYT